MTFQPKVSIIIPVYNGSNYLNDAIESALGQSYSNIEVIVVNDGSKDDGETEKIALGYGDRIKYFSKENGGVSTALNFGIGIMTGEYFSWLSHDDLYRHDKVEQQINFLSKISKREEAIPYSNYSIEFVASNVTKAISLSNTDPQSFRYKVMADNDLHGCTMLVPKKAFVECGTFNEDLRAVQDYEMWFRLAEKYSFIHIADDLVIGRVHSEQVGIRLKGRAKNENIHFRKECLNKLTRKEITSATQKSLSHSLAGLIEVFLKRDLYSVAAHAFILSTKSLKNDGFLNVSTWPFHVVKHAISGSAFACYSILRRISHFNRA